ncbi:hypothetical protein RFI_17312 [Reticulomyxa filosa]|uniref:Uncharacterized protein n=1 Tax=Reticulomyxa filosa TaxID=46433 RepID=X6N208_RETFI|nr:hypothetical protein RFI_17312 [Reticulomyxa filosa]|eukprot:ETO19908.1 hypothetical protein RFI_17312 [Reticulomyxa filosa]
MENEKKKKKKITRRYGLLFCLILYIFIVSDLYTRVTPFLVIVLLYPNWSLEIFLSLCVALSLYEFLMLRFVLLKAGVANKWKDALKYFSIGTISSSYNLLCSIGLKWLPQNISFRWGFVIEHVLRILISIALTGLSVYQQVYVGEWVFQQTTALFVVLVIVNMAVFLIMICKLK